MGTQIKKVSQILYTAMPQLWEACKGANTPVINGLLQLPSGIDHAQTQASFLSILPICNVR